MYGKQLGSHRSRMASSFIVLVTWNNVLFGVSSEPSVERAARINYHPKNDQYGKPVTIWHHDIFQSCGIYSMIPIQFIKSRSVSIIDELDGESVLSLIDF
jgi:hypothetical protein